MSPSSRIPPLLQPHTRLPHKDSIILLTSTLGASANWLIIRFLCEALSDAASTKPVEDGGLPAEGKEPMAVVLVSWMRDWEFWRSEARKGGSLDLERLKKDKRLAFVDGLSKMFLADSGHDTQGLQERIGASSQPAQKIPETMERRPHTNLPVRGPPGRVTPRIPVTTTHTSGPAPVVSQMASEGNLSAQGHYDLTSSDLNELQRTVQNAIQYLQSTSSRRTTLLIFDMPIVALSCDPGIGYTSLCASILRLHTLASHILVHLPADDALISPSDPPQPLEMDAHNLLVKTAHMSTRILSCRVLDTGVAKDVSGVLRVTENNASIQVGFEEQEPTDEGNRGAELLYLVKGDGTVKIFERGAGGDA